MIDRPENPINVIVDIVNAGNAVDDIVKKRKRENKLLAISSAVTATGAVAGAVLGVNSTQDERKLMAEEKFSEREFDLLIDEIEAREGKPLGQEGRLWVRNTIDELNAEVDGNISKVKAYSGVEGAALGAAPGLVTALILSIIAMRRSASNIAELDRHSAKLAAHSKRLAAQRAILPTTERS